MSNVIPFPDHAFENVTAISPYLNRRRTKDGPRFHVGARVWVRPDAEAGTVGAVSWDDEHGWSYSVEADAGYAALCREVELEPEFGGGDAA